VSTLPDYDLYVQSGYWVDGYSVDLSGFTGGVAPVFTTVQNVIPSYLYWQYADDVNLQSFVASYNSIAQQYVNTFNQLNLPVYAGNSLVVGTLLDWVALGIYGMYRPVLSSGLTPNVGAYDTKAPYDTKHPYNENKPGSAITTYVTTDDIFKRIMTWNLYRGDGNIFNVLWLKRHVRRFLEGMNGTDPGIDQTNLISVQFNANNLITIDISAWVLANPTSIIPTIFSAAITSNVLNLPFQYNFAVNTVSSSNFTFDYQSWTDLPVTRRKKVFDWLQDGNAPMASGGNVY
jgi:hypothetical protein